MLRFTIFNEDDQLRNLQYRIAEMFDVWPVDSNRTYEELIDKAAGGVTRITHTVFALGMWMNDMPEGKCCALLAEHAYQAIVQTFSPQSLVVWRARPKIEIAEENGSPKMWICLRLGSAKPRISEEHHKPEGAMPRTINVLERKEENHE